MARRRALPKAPVPAVSAIIIEDGRILLVRRGSAPALGRWSAPGGAIELGETAIEAVKREVLEETGIEIEVGAIAGLSDVIVTDEETGDILYHYTLITFFATPTGGEPMAATDAAEVKWVLLSDIHEYNVTKTLLTRLQEHRLV